MKPTKSWLGMLLIGTQAMPSIAIEPPLAAVAELNTRYQSTQLKLQQQRLDNELARLQLEYAQLMADVQQVTGVMDAQHSQDNTETEAVLSDVQFSHLRLQYINSPARYWRATPMTAEQPR